MVDRDVAKVLVDKYESVEFHNKSDDYNKIAYNKLKKVATDKGVPYKETFVKKEALIDKIEELDG